MRPRFSTEYKKIADPIGNKVLGSITADIHSARGTVNGTNPAGEQPMGDVIADGMLEATKPADFGGAVAAFMNVGGVRASLLYNQISGGEQPGEVTYAEAFAVQPFGNTLVVKTCTGQQLYDVLEQQFENPAAGQQRVMAVSRCLVLLHPDGARGHEAGQRRLAEDRRRRRRQDGELPRRDEQLHRGRRRRVQRLQDLHRAHSEATSTSTRSRGI